MYGNVQSKMSYFSYVFYVLAVKISKVYSRFAVLLRFGVAIFDCISLNSLLNSVIILSVLLGQKLSDIMTSHILIIYVSSCCY